MNPVVEAWIVIEKLGALVATPGISEDVKNLANDQIAKLIKDVITPGLNKLSATSAASPIRITVEILSLMMSSMSWLYI